MAPKDKAKGLFRDPAPMTAMDRTTSEARLIIEEQKQRRAELTASLRAQRLARDAAGPTEAPAKRKPTK
ncbi:hypothetical protein [Paracoccus sp. TOH]|uniref:Transcriptional regulator n=1 Tax=Paracoccus simplex TaxID=2086346 RepID=A0ABV7S0I4_9RHOB|nr:hypothetical protein [Paracoccus sp. TOH]WJS83406.1 hypothetical protein NBE95_06360 [Paracoccus sp. TOH]